MKAKKDIMQSIILNRMKITKELLMTAISQHHFAYQNGIMTYKTMKLLDNAVKLIWIDEFGSDCDIITNIY